MLLPGLIFMLALAVLAHFFAPRSWSALAWVVAFGLLGAAFIGQRGLTDAEARAHAETKTSHAVVLADLANKTAEAHRLALASERAITGRERELQAIIDRQDQEARHAQIDHQKRIDAADAAAASLRDQLKTISRAYTSQRDAANAAAATAAVGPPAGDAIEVLADVLGRCDARAGVYAAAADAAHAAGLACEGAYDAARGAVSAGGVAGLGLKAP